MRGTVVALLVLLCCLSTVYCARTQATGFSAIFYTAQLDAGQLEYQDDDDVFSVTDDDDDDDAITSTNVGAAACQYSGNSRPRVLTCDIQHSSPIATSLEIRKGYKKANGELVQLVASAVAPGAIPTILKWQYVFPADGIREEEFRRGEWYLLIRASTHPRGEIRGQLEQTHRFFAELSFEGLGGSTLRTSDAHGMMVANYSVEAPDQRMEVFIVHNVANSNGAVLRARTTIRTIDVGDSPIRDSFSVSASNEDNLFAHGGSVSVGSTTFNNGQIRGSIKVIDPIPSITHAAILRIEDTIPKHGLIYGERPYGVGIFSFNCGGRRMEFMINHNLVNPTSATVNIGKQGHAGVFQFNLPRTESPIFGLFQLNNDQTTALFANELFIEIYENNEPIPTVRGQITKDFDYFAYLSGVQVIPARTTSAKGAAVIDLRPDGLVSYNIAHNVRDPTICVMQHDDIGRNAPHGSYIRLGKGVGAPVTPLVGDDVLLPTKSSNYDNLRREEMYLSIRSARYADGEIRGQILRRARFGCDPVRTAEPAPFIPPEIPADELVGVGNTRTPSPAAPPPSSAHMLVANTFLACVFALTLAFTL